MKTKKKTKNINRAVALFIFILIANVSFGQTLSQDYNSGQLYYANSNNVNFERNTEFVNTIFNKSYNSIAEQNPGHITSEFLKCRGTVTQCNNNTFKHKGIDYRAKTPFAIYSTLAGTVVGKGGCSAKIAIYNSEYDLTFIYLHLSSYNVYVGDVIKKGQLIGYTGTQGCDANGNIITLDPHLHVELRSGNKTSAALTSATPSTNYDPRIILDYFPNPNKINHGIQIYAGKASSPQEITVKFELEGIDQNFTVSNFKIGTTDISTAFISNKDNFKLNNGNIIANKYVFDLDLSFYTTQFNEQSYDFSFTIEGDNDFKGTDQIYFQDPNSFADISETDWFFDYVKEGVELGLFKGYSPIQYGTENDLSRGAMAKVIVGAAVKLGLYDFDVSTSNGYFDDVPPGHWAFPYVQTLRNKNWIDPNQNFNVGNPISVAQFAKILSNAFELTDTDINEQLLNGNQVFGSKIIIEASPIYDEYLERLCKIIVVKENSEGIKVVENLARGLYKVNRSDIENPQIIVDGNNNVSRVLMAKVISNAYEYKSSVLNPAKTAVDISNYTIIGDKFELTPNPYGNEPITANGTFSMISGETKEFGYISDYSNGEPMFFYWVLDNGNMTSLYDNHRKIEITAPVVTETTELKLYSHVGTANGKVGHVFVTITVEPPTEPTAPTQQASLITIIDKLYNFAEISWDRGNGEYCLVTCTEYEDSYLPPVANTTYSGNSIFTSALAISGSNTKVIYTGTGNTVNITSLTYGSSYRIQVFEYNLNDNSEPLYLYTNPADRKIYTPNPPYSVHFSWSPEALVNVPLTFTSNSSEELTLNWTFEGANVSTATGETVSNVTFATEGTYNVTLTGTDASIGYTETETLQVPVYTISQILPDLKVENEVVTPTDFLLGATINVTADIVNSGMTDANYVWVKYYLSDDNVYDVGDIQLGEEYIAGPIIAGGSHSLSVDYTISTSSGQKYIIIYADRPQAIAEANEDNNIEEIAIEIMDWVPDFYISELTLDQPTAKSGEQVTLHYKIPEDTGDGSNVRVDFLISKNPIVSHLTFDNDAEHIYFTYKNPGPFTNQTTSVFIPEDYLNGNYYIVVWVDPENYKAETNETNNQSSIPITISNPNQPTIQASDFTLTSITDNSVLLSWTNGNGEKRLVIANESGYETPDDGIEYTTNSNYTLASYVNSDADSRAVYAGNGSQVLITNLPTGKNISFAVFEYNGAGASTDYLQRIGEFQGIRTIQNQDFPIVNNWNYISNLEAKDIYSFNIDKQILVSSNYISHTEDGGRTFHYTYTSEYSYNAIDFFNENIGYIVGNMGLIRKTIDGGHTWINQSCEEATGLRDISVLDANIAIAVDYDGHIIRTIDGQNWNVIHTASNDLYASHFINNTTGFVAGRGLFLKTTDGGNTWVTYNVTQYSIWDIYTIYFHNENNGFIFFSDGNIYETENGGTTWELKSSLNNYLWNAHFTSNDVGYVHGGTFLYKTTNGGQTWETIDVGSNIQTFSCLDINNIIISQSNGLFKTNTGGKSQSVTFNSFTFNSGSPNTYCSDVEFDVSLITIGSYNVGNTFKLQISDENGLFGSNPTVLSTFDNQTSGMFADVTLPNGLPTGSNYKFRIASTNPISISPESEIFTFNEAPEVYISGIQDKYYLDESTFNLSSYGNPAGGSFTINGNPVTELNATSLGTGTFTIIYTYNTGSCENSDTYIFEIATPYEISTSNLSNSTYCAGANFDVSYTASGDYSAENMFLVELSDNTGSFTNPTTLNYTESTTSGIINCSFPVTSAQGNMYKIRVIATEPDITGSVNSQFTINSAITPEVTISSNETEICENETVNFNATPTNGGTPVYQWKINGINAGTNSSSFSYNNFTNNDIVSVQMTSDASCIYPQNANSNTVQITVNELVTPYVELYTSSIIGCENDVFEFSAFATNEGENPIYSWTVNGNGVGGNSEYLSTVLTENSVIEVQLISNASCLETNDATSLVNMTINQFPEKAATPSGNNTMCQNSASSVYTTTGATNADSYLWSLLPAEAGVLYPSGTSLLIDWANDYSGVVILSVKGINDCGDGIVSDALPISINSSPTASLTGGATICEGETTNISIALTGQAPWNITYTDGTIPTSITTSNSNYIFNVSQAGTYQVTSISDVNCTGTDMTGIATVTVNSLPTANTTGGATICENETTDISVALTGQAPWNITFVQE